MSSTSMSAGVRAATVMRPSGACPERTPTRSYKPWKPHSDFGKRGLTKRIFGVRRMRWTLPGWGGESWLTIRRVLGDVNEGSGRPRALHLGPDRPRTPRILDFTLDSLG